MIYRLTTRDGTAFLVKEADLELISAYLASKGYPPVSIEVADESSFELVDILPSLNMGIA